MLSLQVSIAGVLEVNSISPLHITIAKQQRPGCVLLATAE